MRSDCSPSLLDYSVHDMINNTHTCMCTYYMYMCVLLVLLFNASIQLLLLPLKWLTCQTITHSVDVAIFLGIGCNDCY